MKQIKFSALLLLLMILFNSSYAIFTLSAYGNIQSEYRDQEADEISPNADWKIEDVRSWFQLDLGGVNMEGFGVWVHLGATIDYWDQTLPNSAGFVNNYFSYPSGLVNSSDYNDGDFRFELFEVHMEKTFDLHKGETRLTAWRGEESRAYIGMTAPGDMFGDHAIGDGETRAGLRWDSDGLFGFSSQGFILDYRSDYKDEAGDTSDPYAYVFGTQWSKDIFDLTAFTWEISLNLGASQYFKRYIISESFTPSGADYTNTTMYFHNVAGLESTMNGSIPSIFNYYISGGVARSYTPEEYVYEYRPGIAFTGNTNSLVYSADMNIDREFEIGNINLGHLFLTFLVYGKQSRFRCYFSGLGDTGYTEEFKVRYNFPYKALSLFSSFKYHHDYEDFSADQFHLWNVGEITDSSVEFHKHLDFTVLFKSDFEFQVAWDHQLGNNYLGSFIPEGVHFITIEASGETEFGSISPQVKVVAPGDQDKQLISTGLDIYLNLSDKLSFYSRFAYVNSKGYWKSGDDLTWWTAFVQFTLNPGNNFRIILELGNGDQTSDGLVSDTDLINGASFEKRVYLNMEYWS